MAKNKNAVANYMHRWNQYLAKWVPFTGSVDEEGRVKTAPADNFEGAPVTVGTSAVKITFAGRTGVISLQSDHGNSSSKIWVGKSNVTSAGANAMARLGQGESLTIELDDNSNAVYVVSDTAAQTVFKLALI